jgi:hypothetical protein
MRCYQTSSDTYNVYWKSRRQSESRWVKSCLDDPEAAGKPVGCAERLKDEDIGYVATSQMERLSPLHPFQEEHRNGSAGWPQA